MANTIQYEVPRGDEAAQPVGGVPLELKVQDPETVAALLACPEGAPRDEFALAALRIGVLALKQARGQLDADLVQRECERMVGQMQRALADHAVQLNQRLTVALGEYFHPETGRFHERVQRLVQKDGELEQILRRQVGREDSELCRTLASHFGAESPLMKVLSPKESEGLLAALREALASQLAAQSEVVLRQFSLDNDEGALARMIKQLTDSHGQLTERLQLKIDDVIKEFSLDEENSALSRLVRNVSTAQERISAEFSLDNDHSALSRLQRMLESTNRSIRDHLTLDDESSALARLKRELQTILTAQAQHNQQFQEEVKLALKALVVKRQEAARSTVHGAEFETVVCEFLQHACQQAGDVAEATGATTGLIRNCKKGDCVITLGPDSAAAGARIVVEAKEKEHYELKSALDEIDEARKNRDAQVGLFVYSRRSAPPGLEPLARYGNDVVVTWDAEDAHSDLQLKAALTLAKALCVRSHQERSAQAADFTAIDGAIREISRAASELDQVTTWTETIRSNGEKILKQIGKARDALQRQVSALEERIADLKQSLSAGDGQ